MLVIYRKNNIFLSLGHVFYGVLTVISCVCVILFVFLVLYYFLYINTPYDNNSYESYNKIFVENNNYDNYKDGGDYYRNLY